MFAVEQVQNLLYSCKSIVDRHEWLAEKQGRRFNIFQLLDRSTDEVKGHSAFLGELLDPKGSHGQGTLFLNAFLDMLRELTLPDVAFVDWLNAERNWITLVEHPIPVRNDGVDRGSGRIDLLLETDDACVIIENKIYAPDQPNQLERYWKFANSINKPCLLIYLTLTGEVPTSYSLGELNPSQVLCLSYQNDIADWIDRCIELSAQLPHIRETLNQYGRLIREISTGIPEEGMIMEIAELFSNPTLFHAACEVERALPHAKMQLQLSFWSHLEQQLNEQFTKCDRETLRNNALTDRCVEAMCFSGRNPRPFGLSLPCGRFENGIELRMVFEIWETFFYGFVLCQDHLRLGLRSDPKATELLDELQKSDAGLTESTRYEDETLFKYTDPLLDWKKFNQHCVDLSDEKVMQETVHAIVVDSQAMMQTLKQLAAQFELSVEQVK